MNLRLITEEREEKFLSEFAQKSKETKGRERKEPLCEMRTEYQRDRDRVIHSKAFRRLKHKTQVFLSPEGDHYRTRLTHTLEVSQIARTISRALGLNEDLTEAISLGHDLGHTPFGHMGERVLDEICKHGFKHNEQSLRMVDVLEKDGGLNLTWEVRDGILCHTGDKKSSTLEGQVVAISDKIAYINHDIDDALRGGVLHSSDIPSEFFDVLGDRHSKRINTMIGAVISSSDGKNMVSMREDIYDAMMRLRRFMFDNVYVSSEPQVEERKAKDVIIGLYEMYSKHPELLPQRKDESTEEEDIDIMVRDYIAGMTDRYAVAKFTELFVPKFWQL